MSRLFPANSPSPPSPKSLVDHYEGRKLPAKGSRRSLLSQSPELETQRRAAKLSALFNSSLSEPRTGVLEEMPPPEVKATVIGLGGSHRQIARN